MKKTIINVLFLLPLLVMTACYDELELYPELGSGTTDVSVTVDFTPLIPTENNTSSTKSAGDALAAVDNLVLFIYNAEGVIEDIRYMADLKDLRINPKDIEGANTGSPSAGQAEKTSARATFTLTNIEAGYYYMYMVANIDITRDKAQALKDFELVSDLKRLQLSWNERDISANRQMFGYLASGDDFYKDGFDAPKVGVGLTSNKLHCWLKRAASKVTVVFDGSGLHDNIWVYIKKVTVKDIPRSCYLGQDNTPASESELIEIGESLAFDNGSGNWADWTAISKGSGKKGAVSTGADGAELLHSEYADALYFFENRQGNYEGRKEYYKPQLWEQVGWIPEKGQDEYKDNVPLGTYVEVEAYYVSDNAAQVTRGDIKYRFMLGQDVLYDYNSTRNHHYKLTLGFKGYANQPDWHIEYRETGELFTPEKSYFMSYQYNRRSEFPIRITGNITGLEIEIVENNWAPYHETPGASDDMQVPPQVIPGEGTEHFEWNTEAYTGNYYYGLKYYDSDGNTRTTNRFTAEEIRNGAPLRTTAPWAGFLALQVNGGNTRNDIPAYLFHVDDGYSYNNTTHMGYLKNYYYGKASGDAYRKNVNSVPQHKRTFTEADLSFAPGQTTKTIGTGNNACVITKAPDGSITVNLPMWTRPKILLGISGFSGNNPYDAYRRRAKVMITATFAGGDASGSVKRIFKDVFQVRRVVNPKAVWHSWNNNDPFLVRLCMREGMNRKDFTQLPSEGAWRAYVKTTSAGDAGFIRLSGGIGTDPETGGILGSTDTPIEFTIQFTGQGEEEKSKCAIVEVQYHGFTCAHTIFVRQGYRQPLEIHGNTKWSSFSLFGCSTTGVDDQFATTWNGSNYIDAEVTASPLALGSFFKRGNYNGILIENNATYGNNKAPGRNAAYKLYNGKTATWDQIRGLALYNNYSGTTAFANTNCSGLGHQATLHREFVWRHFNVKVTLKGQTVTRKYRVPTLADYEALLEDDVDTGVGVMYADGTMETQMDVDDAYGFEDFDNDGVDTPHGGNGSRGMRGVIVYNFNNAHQLFFPIGARGMGRRTITGYTATAYDSFGTLRYSGVTYTLTASANPANPNRPIPFNMPAAPGAIYWLDKIVGSYPGWDMNYFDQNFNAYDYAISFAYTQLGVNHGNGGDALPIKLVLE